MKNLSKISLFVFIICVFGADGDGVKRVSVKEGDSVTLDTRLREKFNHIEWRSGGSIIAETDGNEISYPLNYTERFRDRLKLNDQTGSLTINNMRITDSGLYELEIYQNDGILFKMFSVTVHVFGADGDGVKRVSVMKGDSVTLDTDVTVIKGIIRIQWRFGDSFIAKFDRNKISYPDDERFRDRLKLNHQTGSLTINNMRITDSGLYELEINHNTGTLIKIFSVTVHVFGADEDGVKRVSVMEGDSVTLNTGLREKFNHIKWKLKDSLSIIAETDGNKISYTDDERFRDRLKLNDQTGSLTINNMTITDSGLYKLEINHNTGVSYKTFNVTVNGPSSGAVAGTVVGVLLLVLSAAAVSAFYYQHRIQNDPKRLLGFVGGVVTDGETASGQLSKTFEERTVSVKEGDSVTLKTDAEIQRDDQILWTFGPQDSLIAETKRETGEIATYDGPNRRFGDRLKLDKTTGFLSISNITAEHTGVYKLQTISSRETLFQRFIVTVRLVMISVVEGESVTLYPDTEVKKDDLIVWTFGYEDTLIAQMTGKTREKYEGTDGRFRDRLKVDKRTGSLTIKSTRTEHSGLYKLQMSSSSRGTTNKRFKVAVNLKKISAKEGETVTLRNNTVVQRKDQVLWTFGDKNSLIAEIKGGIGKISTFDIANGRFKDRLGLDEKTGSLTIRHVTTEHAGVYTLKLVTSKATIIRRCNVVVKVLKILGKEGKNVTLNPDTEVQKDDLILWRFGDEDNLIAQLNGETKETTCADADERFRDKLQLDNNTGSLTIRNITNGPYKLQIISSRRTLSRKFRVFMCCESGLKTMSVMMGECLILITDFNIEREERVQWSFGDKTLATGMNGDSSKTSYSDDGRFRDRLELHYQTGSLTIKNIRTSDTGVYQLKFCSRCGKNICWEFSVTVSDEEKTESAKERKSVALKTDTEKQTDEEKLRLDHQTRSLKTTDSGDYKPQIKPYSEGFTGKNANELETSEIQLLSEEDLDRTRFQYIKTHPQVHYEKADDITSCHLHNQALTGEALTQDTVK